MLSPKAAHNTFFRFVTVDELLPLPSLHLPLPLPPPPLTHPTRPQMNLPPLPLMKVVLLGLDDELVE